ncbi:MAG TPA: LptA/OstA family protein [Drouetiella sp.]
MVLKTISASNKNKSMVSIALCALFLQPVAAFAQAMNAAGGPIDIQADEQEFGEGHVVARGRVRVTYKDSVVVAPMATLYRDAGGSPQKAVFTGHPHLLQGANKIDSDVLIFEIASQKIIADGHAHSEVLENAPLGGPMDGPDEAPQEDLNTPGFGKPGVKAAQNQKSTKASKNKAGMSKSGQINWPTKQGDAASDAAAKASAKTAPAQEVAAKPAVKSPIVPRTAADEDYGDARPGDAATPTTEQLMAPPTTSAASGQAKTETKTAKKDPAAKGPPEKIITDSRYQEYNRATGRFEARGDVHVRHGDIRVVSDRLQLVYGADAKPESALFTGHVSATQNENNTQADAMTYFLATQRLQATGNVRSKVIQKKGDGPKKGGPDAGSQESDRTARSGDTTAFTASSARYTDENSKLADNAKASTFSRPSGAQGDKTRVAEGTKAGSNKSFKFDPENKDGEPMYIDSDAQDYSKDSGRMAAQGNVKVRYGDTTGVGPNVVLVRNVDGQAEKLIFTGRSQIIQPGKRWIGDKITMMVNDRKVLAQGNTRAYILQTPGQAETKTPGSLGGKREPLKLTPSIPSAVPTPAAPAASPAKSGSLAGNKSQVSASSNSKVSASKIEGIE